MRKILFSALLLSGCVAVGPSGREIFLGQLIGRPEADAVRELGVPSRSFETGGKRFLAYNESRLDTLPGFYPYGGFGGYGRGFYGGGFAFGPEVIQRECETTLEFADGKVASFTLRGNACG